MSGGVPPSSRAGRKRRPTSNQILKAADLFERFTGHNAEELDTVIVPDLPAVVAIIGELDGVLYTTVRDGRTERYIHEFAKRDKPMLAVSPDGRSMIIVGGAYDFTERGIVDASDTKTRREMGIR